MTDSELFSRVKTGEREAEEILVSRYLQLVRACARPYFLAGGGAEDLIQEGMLGLLTAVREYDPEKGTSFRTFAELLIKRRLYSSMKAALRDKHKPLNSYISIDPLFSDGEALVNALNSQSGPDNPEETVILRERYEEFLDACTGLLSNFEVKILGYYLEGLSTREMSDIAGKPRKSVDNAVQRIRRKLGRHFHIGDSR